MSSPGVNLPALAFSHSDQICLAVSAVNFLSSISHLLLWKFSSQKNPPDLRLADCYKIDIRKY